MNCCSGLEPIEHGGEILGIGTYHMCEAPTTPERMFLLLIKNILLNFNLTQKSEVFKKCIRSPTLRMHFQIYFTKKYFKKTHVWRHFRLIVFHPRFSDVEGRRDGVGRSESRLR